MASCLSCWVFPNSLQSFYDCQWSPGMAWLPFLLASAVSRSARFFLVAVLISKFGEPIKEKSTDTSTCSRWFSAFYWLADFLRSNFLPHRINLRKFQYLLFQSNFYIKIRIFHSPRLRSVLHLFPSLPDGSILAFIVAFFPQ